MIRLSVPWVLAKESDRSMMRHLDQSALKLRSPSIGNLWTELRCHGENSGSSGRRDTEVHLYKMQYSIRQNRIQKTRLEIQVKNLHEPIY